MLQSITSAPSNDNFCNWKESVVTDFLTAVSNQYGESRGSDLQVTRFWVHSFPFSVYLRIQRKFIRGEWMKVFTLASIEVEPQHQQKGLFGLLLARLLERVNSDYQCEAIVVESVINESLLEYLLKTGFRAVSGYEEPLCPNLYLQTPIFSHSTS